MSANTVLNNSSSSAKLSVNPCLWWKHLFHGLTSEQAAPHNNMLEQETQQESVTASASITEQFDRYQLCNEGMVVCQNGWELYRVHSESELLEANLGRISVLKRLCGVSDDEFNFYVIPLIKSMTRYCLILPASEGYHDAEVGGLVKHNLQVAIAALDVVNQSKVVTINNSVRLSSRMEREQALKKLNSFIQNDNDLLDGNYFEKEDSLKIQGVKEDEQLDTLARYLHEASDASDDPYTQSMNEVEFNKFQQKVILGLQEWRQHVSARLQGNLSPEMQNFILDVMVIFHCFAHDLSKLLYDMEIVASNGQRYNAYLQSLAQFCYEQHTPYLLVRYIRNRSDSHKQLGLVDGYFLLSKMNNLLMVLFSQIQTIGSMALEPEPVLNQLLIYAERNLITNEMQMQSVGKMYLPTYVSALIKQMQEIRAQDGMFPNEIESDYYTSGNHVLIQNNSRSWALFSWWVQEKEFGPMAFHEQSNANLVNKVLLTANVSRVLQIFASKAMYFMVFAQHSLLLVRGIDLYSNNLNFNSDVTIMPISVKHPLLQQALHAIILALYHQRQTNLNDISANADGDGENEIEEDDDDIPTETNSPKPHNMPHELSANSMWQGEVLHNLHFAADKLLTTAMAVAAEPSVLEVNPTADAIVPNQVKAETEESEPQTSGQAHSFHCTWQEVEFMDMPLAERFSLLKANATFKQIETGRSWLRQLLCMPNKIALSTYLAANGAYKTKLKVYFANQDQDFKAFCKKRAEQRKENNKRKIRASAAMARQSLKAKF